MRIQKDIKELLDKEVISEDTASRLRSFYEEKAENSQTRLFTIFGVLGAMLIGLGVVLIIAHNWDNFSRGIKTVLAFLPLLVAQGIVVYTKRKQTDRVAWNEGSAILLFFAIGACISMISQIYHVVGNLGDYLFTWMILALPIVYLLPSGIVAIFYLMGITYMGAEVGYFNERDYTGINKYWLMILALGPYYYWMMQNRRSSNFLNFLNWLIPISVIICLGLFADRNEEWMMLAYMSLFGILYNLGDLQKWFENTLGGNGFKFLGALGSVIILLISSFREFWNEIKLHDGALNSPEFYVFVLLTILAAMLAAYNYSRSKKLDPKQWIFLLFVPLFFVGMESGWVMIIMNLLVLAFGVQTIKEGADEEHLGLMNFGLLVIAALIASRFFDVDMSFVVRGLVFILLGLAFFLLNYWMLKRRKNA